MADVSIILNNSGNNRYAQTSREFIANPMRSDMLRLILDNETQIGNLIKIRNAKSFGSESNRDIQIRKYIKATDKTSLVVDIPLFPEIVLDGQTYFQTDIEANSSIYMMFYYEQLDIGDFLR